MKQEEGKTGVVQVYDMGRGGWELRGTRSHARNCRGAHQSKPMARTIEGYSISLMFFRDSIIETLEAVSRGRSAVFVFWRGCCLLRQVRVVAAQ